MVLETLMIKNNGMHPWDLMMAQLNLRSRFLLLLSLLHKPTPFRAPHTRSKKPSLLPIIPGFGEEEDDNDGAHGYSGTLKHGFSYI